MSDVETMDRKDIPPEGEMLLSDEQLAAIRETATNGKAVIFSDFKGRNYHQFYNALRFQLITRGMKMRAKSINGKLAVWIEDK